MGTGVNAQLRLKALHHLDVPWLPSHIEQREGRIVRPGNQHDEVDIYAYATEGSLFAVRRQVRDAERDIETSTRRNDEIGQDIARFVPTAGDEFAMRVAEGSYVERKEASRALMYSSSRRATSSLLQSVVSISNMKASASGRTAIAIPQSLCAPARTTRSTFP
jgi:hypothetical protein